MKKICIIILSFTLFFLLSCTENTKKAWQNNENINNSDLEGYIQRNDSGVFLDDETNTIDDSISQKAVVSDKNPNNF